MANRFYLVPKIGDGLTPFTAFRPKYTDNGDLGAGWNLSGRFSSLDYGAEACMLMVSDVTAEEHNALAAQTDVLAVPIPLNDNVGAAAVNIIQNKLEGANLPAEWVTTALTYRQVLRTVRRIITFIQRFRGLFNASIFIDGVTLDSRINQIPAAKRSRLADTAADLGLSTEGITGTTTIRVALRMVADQLPDVVLGGETI